MWLLTAVAGCVPSIVTVNGSYLVQSADVTTLGGTYPAPMLVGTRFCPVVTCLGPICPTGDLAKCLDQSMTGATLEPDTGCVVFDRPGPVIWDFTPVTCASAAPGWQKQDDQLAFGVVPAKDVDEALRLYELATYPAEGEAFPDDWLPADGDPWPLVVGEPFRFAPELYWSQSYRLEVGYAWGGLQGHVDGDGAGPTVSAADGLIEVRYGDDGSPATVIADIEGGSWPIADVIPVDSQEAASLEVVVGYFVDGSPAGARAVVRDSEGRALFGAPVRWHLEDGLLSLDSDAILGGADYTALLDECIAPEKNGGVRHAEVRATLGPWTAVAPIDWHAHRDTPIPGWVPDPDCVEGSPSATATTPSTPGTDSTATATDPGDTEATPTPVFHLAGGYCSCGGAHGFGPIGVLVSIVAARRRSVSGSR